MTVKRIANERKRGLNDFVCCFFHTISDYQRPCHAAISLAETHGYDHFSGGAIR
jgi:hypothetical protein